MNTCLARTCKFFVAFLILFDRCDGNDDANRLYHDLISRYNNLVRPVVNNTDVITVEIRLKLSQLIDVNLKNQIMTTNLWVEQYWHDYKLHWDPKDYGGVKTLHIPSDHMWRPDILLYNNADGNFEVTLSTKAALDYKGNIAWKPPAIYKSSCEIDVEYFPFDEQTCRMKFGSWTYDGFKVDLRHKSEAHNSSLVEFGFDMSEFYMSVEWDILAIPAVRHEVYYVCCKEPFVDLTFSITMRRKTLFYTVNLIVPCMAISFLTILVFYLPSESGEKVTLSISILLSLTVFFLLLAEIIPPTSLVVPLLGKYLLFTMILVTLSIIVTVGVLNVHFRSPSTHRMAPWVRLIFMEILPPILLLRKKDKDETADSKQKIMIRTCNGIQLQDASTTTACGTAILDPYCPAEVSVDGHQTTMFYTPQYHSMNGERRHSCEFERQAYFKEPIVATDAVRRKSIFGADRALQGVGYIATHLRLDDEYSKVQEDWKFVAMVLDRLFLWIFTIACITGTCGIILQAPTLYDNRNALDFDEIFKFRDNKL
ncbi:nAChRa3 (predicted) [Pycnogonum litorale]